MEIGDILDRIDILKKDLRTARKELEKALMETDTYKTVYEQTKTCDIEVSDKDARKHALAVSLKHFST